jgi:hypothetical protein
VLLGHCCNNNKLMGDPMQPHSLQLHRIYGRDSQEVGAALGAALKAQIEAAVNVLPHYETFRLRQPWWMPFRLFLYLASLRAKRALQMPVKQVFPEMATRLDTMAKAAGVNLSTLYLFHGLESMLTSLGEPTAALPFAGCSAVAVAPRCSASGQALMQHNFDNVPLLDSILVLRERRELGKYRSIEFGVAPLGGAIDGMNEEGLSIAYNFAWTKHPGPPAPPVSMAISAALDCCATVAEAARFICSRPRCGGSMLMLADASGDIGRLELGSGRAVLIRPRSSGYLMHSNGFQTRRFRRLRVAASAVYSRFAPRLLRGKRVLESTEARDRRLENLLGQRVRFDSADLARIMSDHGPEVSPGPNTVCMHGPQWTTLASLQFHPRRRLVRVIHGRACAMKFEEFQL